MACICAKLQDNLYRKIVSTDEAIYLSNDIDTGVSMSYRPATLLDEGEWFSIDNASAQPYKIDLLTADYSSVDFESLSRDEFGKISFIFIQIDNQLCIQKVSKSKLIAKKALVCFGESFKYDSDRLEIVINPVPDAIYNKDTDVLYFKKLESITSIFKGIEELYKEATDEETKEFLSSDFIKLKPDYDVSKVKTMNRKRIALAIKVLENLDERSKNNIFKYIREYCPKLSSSETSFEIGNEEELKLLLFGIDQRFYTTPVGGEKRIANSVTSFKD